MKDGLYFMQENDVSSQLVAVKGVGQQLGINFLEILLIPLDLVLVVQFLDNLRFNHLD